MNKMSEKYQKAILNPPKRGPLLAHILLIIQSDDMEPKRYESLHDAALDMGILRQTLTYAHKNGKPIIMKYKGGVKVFYVECGCRATPFPVGKLLSDRLTTSVAGMPFSNRPFFGGCNLAF